MNNTNKAKATIVVLLFAALYLTTITIEDSATRDLSLYGHNKAGKAHSRNLLVFGFIKCLIDKFLCNIFGCCSDNSSILSFFPSVGPSVSSVPPSSIPSSSIVPSHFPSNKLSSVPSTSLYPSFNPSSLPTFSSRPSTSPTTSLMPTTSSIPSAYSAWNQVGADVVGPNGPIYKFVSLKGDRLWAGRSSFLSLKYLTAGNEWKSMTDLVGSTFVIGSLSTSVDGKTFVMGDYIHNGNTGQVFVFREDGVGTWKDLGETITGEYDSGFGYAVDIDGSGNTIVVGAMLSGYASIFEFSGSSWILVRSISGDDNTWFGCSVGLSSDVYRLIVGACETDSDEGTNVGTVFLYGLGPFESIQQMEGDNTNDKFGIRAAISSDGSVVAVGTSGDYVKLFRATTGALLEYIPVGDNLVGSADSNFGSRLALSADGGRMVVGADSNDEGFENSGKTFVYAINNNDIKLIGEFLGEAGDRLGTSVAISEDGTRIATGAKGTGYVHVYESFDAFD